MVRIDVFTFYSLKKLGQHGSRALLIHVLVHVSKMCAVTVKTRSHRAKSNAKAKKIKEQPEGVKEKIWKKENFRFRSSVNGPLESFRLG